MKLWSGTRISVLFVALFLSAPAAATKGAVSISSGTDSRDYLLLAMAGIFIPVKTLDGQEHLALKESIPSDATIHVCYVPSSRNPKTTHELYQQAVSNELRAFLEGLRKRNKLTAEVSYCDFRDEDERDWARWFYVAPVLIVPPQVHEKVQNLSKEFGATYMVVGKISFTKINEEVIEAQNIAQSALDESEAKSLENARELDRLAAANSTDKIGSLSFDFDWKKGPVGFCTLSYEGASGIAIREYGRLGLEILSDSFRSGAAEVGATFDREQPIARTFVDIETMYHAWQQNHSDCRVYVDFPYNLKMLADAARRDSNVEITVNELIPVSDLKDSWARREGYSGYGEYQVISERMGQMQVNPRQYGGLTALGISSKASMDDAFQEMRASGYSSSASADILIEYLTDRAAAARRPGTTAASVRDERKKREASVQARAAAETQAQRLLDEEFSSISGVVCRQHQHVLSQVVAGYRQAGVPLNNAQSVFDSESNRSLRVFLISMTRELYANPENTLRRIESVEFLRSCVKIHRGY